MKTEETIEDFNRKTNAPSEFQDTNLTDSEKSLMQTYSPQKSLIIYGTLAPNAPNHHIIEHIKGHWQQAIVRGSLVKEGWGAELGYYGFKHIHEEKQEEIDVFVLISEELEANWQFLDDFEGSGYRRILAKYELKNGHIGVGYIYAINEEEI